MKKTSVLVPFPISQAQLSLLVNKCDAALHALQKEVMDGLNPPSGAYGLFHYLGHVLVRVHDTDRIVTRLFAEVHRLLHLHAQEERLTPRNWPSGKPLPKNLQKLFKESHELTQSAQLDFESLYVFGMVMLDQWSLIAASIANLPIKRKHPFVELVDSWERDASGSLASIWEKYHTDILWLHYQLRFYRNRFIVHANRPWSRGATRTVWGEDFVLFTPTPPGWLDDGILNKQILDLLPLAPARIRDATDDYWEKVRPGRIIEVLFEDIGNIKSRDDREKIAELYGKKGGSTPSFQIIAGALLVFIEKATNELIAIAKNNLSSIDLGKPNKTSQEMWMNIE